MHIEKLLYGLALYDDAEIRESEIYRKHISFIFDYFLDIAVEPIDIDKVFELDLDLSILDELEELVINLLDIEKLDEKSKKIYEIYKSLKDIDIAQMDLQNLETNIACISNEAKYKLF